MTSLKHSAQLLACLALLLSASSIGFSQEPAAAEVASPETSARPLPPEEEEVKGTCLTPRQAYLQLLWWAKTDPAQAALCFDKTQLPKPERAHILARRLVDYLDANAIHIATTKAPIEADYIDPETRRAVYADPSAPEFEIARQSDGRWLFTTQSLMRIPEPSLAIRVAGYLPGWFHGEFLGIAIWKFVGVVFLIFIAFLVQKTTVFFVRTYLGHLVSRTNLTHLHKAIKKADRPIGGLSMAAVFYLGFPLLAFPLEVSNIALIATKAVAAFSVVWVAYRLIDVLTHWMDAKAEATDTKLDDQLVPLVSKTLKVFVSVIGGIFVLQNLSVDVGSLLAGVGLGGLAFALAAKDTVANFFGSVMIFIDKPFQIGDWVVIDGVEGTVEEVGFRTSRIRTFYNSLVTLPNSIVPSTAVDNYGMRSYRRYSTTLGLTYDTPPEKVQAFCEALRALIAAMPGMRKDYYMVEFQGFGDCSLNIMLYCFMVSKTWNEEMRTRTFLNLEVLRIAKELGVGFAFPTRTLHVDSLVKSGESKPGHFGATDAEALKQVIESRAPKKGPKLRAAGVELTSGYDCSPDWE